MPEIAGKCREALGYTPRAMDWHLGKAVTGGGLGFARRLPRGGAPARAARRQVRRPGQARTGNSPQRPREKANARTASGHEHQGNEASRANWEKSKTWNLRASGRSALPEPPATIMGVSRNPSRASSLRSWASPTLERNPSDRWVSRFEADHQSCYAPDSRASARCRRSAAMSSQSGPCR